METMCDKCGKVMDNDFSNYCNQCREEYHKGIALDRERMKKSADEAWERMGA